VCRSTIIGEPTSVGNCMIVKPIADPRDGCMEILEWILRVQDSSSQTPLEVDLAWT
jgi:hypothetical protein